MFCHFASAKLVNMATPPTLITPLLHALRQMTTDEKARFAALSGTTKNYAYQVATCKRPNPSAAWATAVEDALRVLNRETEGRVPVVTVREMATMCALAGLGGVAG